MSFPANPPAATADRRARIVADGAAVPALFVLAAIAAAAAVMAATLFLLGALA